MFKNAHQNRQLVSSSYVFFFLPIFSSVRSAYKLYVPGVTLDTNAIPKDGTQLTWCKTPSTRQRHGIIALRHLALVPPRYPRTQQTVRIQNRTSQDDESCIGHGNKQEPTPEHSLTLALWHSRSYRPKLAPPIRASIPEAWHSLYQANCLHLLSRIVLT